MGLLAPSTPAALIANRSWLLLTPMAVFGPEREMLVVSLTGSGRLAKPSTHHRSSPTTAKFTCWLLALITVSMLKPQTMASPGQIATISLLVGLQPVSLGFPIEEISISGRLVAAIISIGVDLMESITLIGSILMVSSSTPLLQP